MKKLHALLTAGIITLLLTLTGPLTGSLYSQDIVTNKAGSGAFPIVRAAVVQSQVGTASPKSTTASPHVTAGSPLATAIYVGKTDHWLVQKAAALLQSDIEKVTGTRPVIMHELPASVQNLIIIGSIDSDTTSLINTLLNENRIPADSLKGKWEAYTLQILQHPVKGIGQALIIAGSDRRGTAFGIFELSRRIGISPWYWWADVPVPHQKSLYISSNTRIYDAPTVKYRGFFINDEAPALSGWAREKFGGLNHLFYEKVFELLLRMKANYLWPAMWGNAFNDDDPTNPVLAGQYGIVMGTSHHEPMLRSQQEWKRYGSGPWNYTSNEDTLKAFWKKGIINMGSRESIVTIGMRGDGDMPMTEGSNISLLEKIVHDQRDIISSVTGKAPSATPQTWALYKEVQDYYDKGMRVPDDVTLLLCDDNWGNVRKLPQPGEKPRAGGYGMYYHFDYVGDPRNYKWLNTNSIPRIWEQLHLTWQYGADQVWIVNVGDIKPMELPIEFFLDYAWNPAVITAARLNDYTRNWAARQFGPDHAAAIADILTKYTQYNARRKPELLSPDTYSLLHYREAETVTAAYNKIASSADSIYHLLPAVYRDAYYQLVLYPVLACSNLNELYYTVAKNRLYAAQGRTMTNDLAQHARSLFTNDSILSHYYNTIMSGGKWNHMMDQTHIGYTEWQQPPVNAMPEVKTIDILPSGHKSPLRKNLPPSPGKVSPAGQDSLAINQGCAISSWGLSIEGSASWWPCDTTPIVLPLFDGYYITRQDRNPPAYQNSRHYIELFNRRSSPFNYRIESNAPWLHISSRQGTIDQQTEIWVSIDGQQLPPGISHATLTISVPGTAPVTITAILRNTPMPKEQDWKGFLESDDYVSMEAEHYSKAVGTTLAPAIPGNIQWQCIPGLGRTFSGMQAIPVTAFAQTPGGNSPHLEYNLFLYDSGTISVQAYFSPLLKFNGKSLHYAISIDDETPQIIDITAKNESINDWQQMVADNIKIMKTVHQITHPGNHILKYWLVDPGVVLQKLVLNAGGVKPAYLGPPESPRITEYAGEKKIR
jgi:glycosyl hydrolase family 115 (putative glucuronidase)/glycosyl hydrolase family 115/BACON domain-containing protein